METAPARLHVMFARKSRKALVLRRGPARHVATFLWDRSKDVFEIGQWLKGRIYEDNCDLSPDGKHFLYFALNGHWEGEAQGAWSAISRTPYLKALVLYPKGDTWGGGGLWIDNKTLWLHGCHDEPLQRLPKRFSLQDEIPYKEKVSIRQFKLLRGGWVFSRDYARADERVRSFEREIQNGWVLVKHCYYQYETPKDQFTNSWEEHELHSTRTGETIDCSDWQWADWDRHRLVWATNGVLYTGRIDSEGLNETKMLFDFNPLTFERIKAPY